MAAWRGQLDAADASLATAGDELATRVMPLGAIGEELGAAVALLGGAGRPPATTYAISTLPPLLRRRGNPPLGLT
jgi:hypothetical protein